MKDVSDQRRWGFVQRLEFIEFRLFWDGQINRADIIEKFRISEPQASADLTAYQSIAPGNIEYDKSRKTYVASAKFKPAVTHPTARHYFSQLRALDDKVLTRDETWLGTMPPYAVVPLVRRRLDERKLRTILQVIRSSQAIHVEYQSFSKPEATQRWITPHALGFDGFRWHLRAWCDERRDFLDFVLARLLRVHGTRPGEINAHLDRAWHTMITFRLGPNPKLELAQRRAIELDYGMRNGCVEVSTRECMSYYLERQLGLDLDPVLVPPARQQLILLNRDEVEATRHPSERSPLESSVSHS
ncbi:MAG: WYL domain-containing protein [Pirellulaceae bacterium]